MASGGRIETIAIVGAGSGGFGVAPNLGALGYRLRAVRARGVERL